MSRAEALKAMTIWPAYAAFQDSVLGSIKPGKLADFTVLDRDIMTVPTNQILSAGVVATFVGGRQVYSRAAAGQLREPPAPRIHPDPLPPQITPSFAVDSAAVVAAVNQFHAALAAGTARPALSKPEKMLSCRSRAGSRRKQYRSDHLSSDIEFLRAAAV